jgi:hypothetical protein
VKKALIYLFLPIILLNGSVCELLKTPLLISHYLTHRKLNHVGVMQFISMHYLGNDINDNDDAEDNKLPFKKADCNTFIQFNVPLTQSAIKLKKPFYSLVQPNIYPLSLAVCNAPLDPSFKPPQV